MDREALVASLRPVLSEEVCLAILFGSAARDRLCQESDVDIAFVPRQAGLSLHAELDLQDKLARVCGRPVDLVRLDEADTLLRWQVAKHGVLITANPGQEHARFLARAASDYLDLEPSLRSSARRYASRLREPT